MKEEFITRLAEALGRAGNLEGVCGAEAGEEPAIEAGHMDDYTVLLVLSRMLSEGTLTLRIAPEAAGYLAKLLHFTEDEEKALGPELEGRDAPIHALLDEAMRRIIGDRSVGRKQAEGAAKTVRLVRALAMENGARCTYADSVLEKIAAEHPYKVPGDPDSYSPYNEAWQDCLARVDQELFAARDGGWIPAGEGYPLPEERENPVTKDFYEYPVTVEINGTRDVRYYKFGRGHWWHGPAHMDHYVKAWLPVPGAYLGTDGD